LALGRRPSDRLLAAANLALLFALGVAVAAAGYRLAS
jgi:hypothetical protein